jgi:hypothetical protein
MRADNTAHLATAARRRHELARAKTIRALRELDQAGSPVTFPIVARHAGVSRSWLYTQPDITTEIQRLRTLARRAPATRLPAQQRSSDASLRQRLQSPSNATANSPRTTSGSAGNSHKLSDNSAPPAHQHGPNRQRNQLQPIAVR